ncbi:thioredoxin [Deinococcus oregonensis]|uniref:Thioredoxin n=1 Tax=Deinococcus oregonensis TaxID=1805970 RepID=A0ABV6AZP0_9DEIO
MPHPLSLTDQSFAPTVADGLTLVDFWAPWCAPCRALAPTLTELASDYAGRVTVAKLDVDEWPELAGHYGVRSLPTLILFQAGQPVRRLIGTQPRGALVNLLEGALSEDRAPGSVEKQGVAATL